MANIHPFPVTCRMSRHIFQSKALMVINLKSELAGGKKLEFMTQYNTVDHIPECFL